MKGFFHDFVQRLCDDQNFIDVAPEGLATQSSLSRWSQEDDAQRAVSDLTTSDFAFHTKHEDKAWWALDLGNRYFPTLICIENRKRRDFRQTAAGLKILASVDGENWTTLHAGEVHFGGQKDGIPLLLPLDEKVPLRYIRLENTTPGPLHLSAVRVFVKGLQTQAEEGPDFIANRTDGLGERLKAVVNSIVLAEHFGGSFGFSWHPISASVANNHAIGTPEDIFSETFLQTHLRNITPEVPLKNFLEDRKNFAPETTNSYIVDVPQSSVLLTRDLGSRLAPEDFGEAFEKIEFSSEVALAITTARAIDLNDDSVGLHLRAGDIVFGRYRFNARYLNKVIPYPLADDFVQNRSAQGQKTVLFGQDQAMCRELANQYGAIFAGDYHEKYQFNTYQAALFDIVLMSRCSKVIAGSSGFSQIAQLIGQFEMIDPLDMYPKAEAASIIETALHGAGSGIEVHNLQRAFACSYAVNRFKKELSVKARLELIKIACELDPENAFYALLHAELLFEVGAPNKSKNATRALMSYHPEEGSMGTLEQLVSTRHPDGSSPLDSHKPRLEKMADQGDYCAAGILALYWHHAKNGNLAKKYSKGFVAEWDGPIGPTTRLVLSVENG